VSGNLSASPWALLHEAAASASVPTIEWDVPAGTCRCVVTDEAADPFLVYRLPTVGVSGPGVAPPPGAAHLCGHPGDQRWSCLAAVTANLPLGPSSYGEP
jgi:hypothetical protein